MKNLVILFVAIAMIAGNHIGVAAVVVPCVIKIAGFIFIDADTTGEDEEEEVEVGGDLNDLEQKCESKLSDCGEQGDDGFSEDEQNEQNECWNPNALIEPKPLPHYNPISLSQSHQSSFVSGHT